MRREPHTRQATFLSVLVLGWTIACIGTLAPGQSPPVNGMRPADLRAHAIVDATVITAPGSKIEHATIVMRDGVIESVGAAKDVKVPADARIWPGSDMTVYPGLIESALLIRPSDGAGAAPGSGAYWNTRIHPEVAMSEQPGPDMALRKDLRAMGFTAAAVYPSTGALRGSGVVIALADENEKTLAYRQRAAMAAGFDYGGFGRGGGGADNASNYPGSLMGAIALLRQALLDAQWHAECRRVWLEHPSGNEPPARSESLAALNDILIRRQPVLFEVTDEANALRAGKVAREFRLDLVLLGSGFEFRRLNDITSQLKGVPIILPLDFPKRPDVSTIAAADNVSLRDLMTWEQAPTNPRRLLKAGTTIALTTHKLKSRSDFPANLRSAIKHGLTEDEALAALTTTPARLLGLDAVLGTIAPGKAANLVVVKGSLFDKEAKIYDTWVDGRRYEVYKDADVQLKGSGTIKIERPDNTKELKIDLDTTKSTVTLHLPDDKKIAAKKVVVQQDQISFVTEGRPLDVEGYVRFSGVIEGHDVSGTAALPDGSEARFTIDITPKKEGEDAGAETKPATQPEKQPEKQADAAGNGEGKGKPKDDEAPFVMPSEALNVPLGEFGLAAPPRQQNVLFTNATIWTCGPKGVIQNGSMLILNGRIRAIGEGNAAGNVPDAVSIQTVDLHGKHITPGLIDCHSHTGIDGGVNEFAQTNTAECRVGDCIDPDDISWYRELAGGLIAANQLHGSANPIGGQNSVVKIKWGRAADDFRIQDAIPGIKFALGENVKRSTGRYPNTRMGVETFFRDAFAAAKHYKEEGDRYAALPQDQRKATMPPRRDLELDALVEVLDHARIIHCHSYRQDEILMLIRVADSLGFTIGTFQHVLEGYKVADAIATHGAGGSTFSDWWAYKMEVMDAIPYNGALMHDLGIVVSFNSDSDELARRLNYECAKAVRYGGVAPEAALQFVTINPAKQLRIDKHTGSLEEGKDADLAIWSGDPLSAYTICEQTWIEGARYFDLETDKQLRADAQHERQRIIQKILVQAHGEIKKEPESQPATAPASQPHISQTRLAWMIEQVRLGRDPESVMPGECGCEDWWAHQD